MMRTVHLHGQLSELFGGPYRIDVVTPAEAIRALGIILGDDFIKTIQGGEWHIVAGDCFDEGEDFGTEELCHFGLGASDLHIAPAVSGSGGGFFKAVLGVALLATAVVTAGSSLFPMGIAMNGTAFTAFGASVTWGNLATLGGMMALSGVAEMLSPTPKLSSGYASRENPEDQPSFLFNGARNTSEQGGPVNMVYGRHRTGWTLVSSGTSVEDVEAEGGGTGRERDNTLRSKSVTRAVGILSEGEIGGLVDGAKSIFFGDTPLMASDGTYNFEGVSWEIRHGMPDQDYIPGFPEIENETEVAALVAYDNPVVRSITNSEADAARVRIRLAEGLLTQNANSGWIETATVDSAIDIREAGGEWSEIKADTFDGKATSAYERAYRIEKPRGWSSWDIRVRRTTEDTDSAYIKDAVTWQAVTEIVDAKLTYPDTAVICLTVDAELFGNSVPTVSFEIYGIKVEVPSNYDPQARTYDGIWDGTFKIAWTDNPAWIVRDVLSNDRYGLGLADIDKWILYEMAQYNDGFVPDGYGGTEPRFTLNIALQTQEEAYHVVNSMVSSMRAMCYWASGAVAFSQDSPNLPTLSPISAANVENGDINYQGTSKRSRHTVALVTWNDPDDAYRPAVEVVEHAEGIARYGWQPTDIVAIGCTSRGQAHRLGKWTLDTEQHETDIASWVNGLDHANAVPGEVIPVADEAVAGLRMSGRIKSAEGMSVTIDAPVNIEPGEGYVLTVVLPDNTTADRVLTNAPGKTDVLTFNDELSTLPQPGAMWVISATNAETRLFRIVANRNDEIHKFELLALEHDPNKFGRVEQGIQFDPKPVSVHPTGPLSKPTSLAIDEYLYTSGDGIAPGVLLSWVAASDSRVARYEVEIKRPGDVWEPGGTTPTVSKEFQNTRNGTYGFRIRSLTATSLQSGWLTMENVEVVGLNQPPNDVQNLVMCQRNGQGVIAWDAVVDWRRMIYYEIRKGTVWDTAMPLGQTHELTYPVGTNGTYMVKAVAAGSYSDNPAMVVVDGSGRLSTNVLAEYDEDARGWLGTFGGSAIESDGNVTLSDPSSEGWYEIPASHIVTMDSPALCNVSVDYQLYGASLVDDIYDVVNVYDITDLYGGYGQYVHAVVYIRTMVDSVWGEWRKYIPGSYYGEQFDFYILLTSDRADVAPLLTELSFSVDVPDRVERKDNLIIPVTGLDVEFSTKFNIAPAVVTQVLQAAGGEDVELSGVSQTGMSVKVKDISGAYTERSINFIAQGY